MHLEIQANPPDAYSIAALEDGMKHDYFFVFQNPQDVSHTLECRTVQGIGGKRTLERSVVSHGLTHGRETHEYRQRRCAERVERCPCLRYLRQLLRNLPPELLDAGGTIRWITHAGKIACLVLARTDIGRTEFQRISH